MPDRNIDSLKTTRWLHGSNRLPSDPQNPSSSEDIIIVVDFYRLSVRESGCNKRFLSPCSPIPTTIELSQWGQQTRV